MGKKVPIGPYSAYAIARQHGFEGTEAEWIASTDANRIKSEAAAKDAQNSLKELKAGIASGNFKGEKGK